MVDWPATLPDSPLIEGFEEEDPDLVLKSETDVGPGKRRLRGTAGLGRMMYPLMLTTEQRAALLDFYRTDLARGVLSFNLTHPITGDPIECFITKPPRPVAVSHNRFRVVLELGVKTT